MAVLCAFIHCALLPLSSDVIVSCILLYHFSSNDFDIPEPRRMALLMIQVPTVHTDHCMPGTLYQDV